MTTLPSPEPSEVTYREKVAWLGLVTTLVLYVPYFLWLSRWLGQHPDAGAAVVLLSLVGVGALHALLLPLGLLAWWLLGQRAPDLPADERDRALQGRATRAAYFTLVGLGFSLPFLLLATQPAWLGRAEALLPGFLLCFVVAELVGFAVQVAGYRRGY